MRGPRSGALGSCRSGSAQERARKPTNESGRPSRWTACWTSTCGVVPWARWCSARTPPTLLAAAVAVPRCNSTIAPDAREHTSNRARSVFRRNERGLATHPARVDRSRKQSKRDPAVHEGAGARSEKPPAFARGTLFSAGPVVARSDAPGRSNKQSASGSCFYTWVRGFAEDGLL